MSRKRSRDIDGTVSRTVVNAGFRLTQACYTDIPELPTHSHPLARICLTMEGTFRETIDGQVCECRPGTVLLRSPGAPHNDRIGPGTLRNILIEVEPRRFEEIRGVFDGGFAPRLFQAPPAEALPARIEREMCSNDSPVLISLESLLLRLVSGISRDVEWRRGLESQRATAASSLMREAVAMIERVFPASLGVSDIARELGVSVSWLAAEFRRRERCSVREYIRRRRVDLAKRLLGEMTLPIASVALEAGFCDQAHLNREFMAAVGTTPGLFRREIRSPSPGPLGAYNGGRESSITRQAAPTMIVPGDERGGSADRGIRGSAHRGDAMAHRGASRSLDATLDVSVGDDADRRAGLL